jgi:hypothetical protein
MGYLRLHQNDSDLLVYGLLVRGLFYGALNPGLYSVELQDDWWMTNGNWFERKRSSPDRGIMLDFSWRDWRNRREPGWGQSIPRSRMDPSVITRPVVSTVKILRADVHLLCLHLTQRALWDAYMSRWCVPVVKLQSLWYLISYNKLRGFSPQANYTDRAAKLMRPLADRGCRVVSATNPHCRYFRFF